MYAWVVRTQHYCLQPTMI
uniref:Uncharacterized protein n=1 Tax=Anguilla anguilla TaxID=7936 RepID=A0A0E9SEE0_ANGAN